MTILFIDGSYLIFYRYNALLNYFRLRIPETTTPYWEMVEFQSMFRRKIKECIYHLQQHHKPSHTFIALDSLLSWRKQINSHYKENRHHEDVISFVFQTAIEEMNLLSTASVIEVDYAEADDIIHHYVRWLQSYQYPQGMCMVIAPKKQWNYYTTEMLPSVDVTQKGITVEEKQCIEVVIIASDKDYLPLVNECCHLITLQEKEVRLEHDLTGDEFLKVKIIMGDKSDCIESIIPKCGIKKAISLVKNNSELEKLLSNEMIRQRWEENERLIDNRCIPVEIQEQIRLQFNLFVECSNIVQKCKEG